MSQVLFLELSVTAEQEWRALELLRALKSQLEARSDVRGAQLLHAQQHDQHVFLLESKWVRPAPATLAGWPTALEAQHRQWTFEVLEGASALETLTNWRRSRFDLPALDGIHQGTIKLEALKRNEYPPKDATGYPAAAQAPVEHRSTWTQASNQTRPNWPLPSYPTGRFGASAERNPMQPAQPLKVLKESTLMAMAEDMNKAQGVAVALLPRFGVEITVDGQQFQVNIAELQTGHDIRLARDVAAGIQEAMRQLVEKIDAHLGSQNPSA